MPNVESNSMLPDNPAYRLEIVTHLEHCAWETTPEAKPPRYAQDELCDRIDAMLDNRDYTELELPSTAWRRWAYYAAKGEWQ